MSETASAVSPLLAGLTAKGDDPVLWLGTVSPRGRPSVRPVWFVDTTFSARITITPTRAWGW